MGSLTRSLRRNARPPARGKFLDPGESWKVRVLGDPHLSQYPLHNVDYASSEARLLASMGLSFEFCVPCGKAVFCKDGILSHYREHGGDRDHMVAEIMES